MNDGQPKRIMVVGPAGSGKSTSARYIATRTGLPLHHLDAVRWTADWRKLPTAQWKQVHHDLAQADEWIMDGNYTSTMADRLRRTDLVVFLHTPMLRCVLRILRRHCATTRGRPVDDLPAGSRPRLNMALRKGTVLRHRELTELTALLRAAPHVPVAEIRSSRQLADVFRTASHADK